MTNSFYPPKLSPSEKKLSVKTLALLIGLLFFSLSSFSQENCTNGVDDDGDGLIDCQDPDCGNSSVCKISPSCTQPYIYYMPPIYGDKVSVCDIFGSDDIVLTTLNSQATVTISRGDGTVYQNVILPAASPVSVPFPNSGVNSDQVLNPSINTTLSSAGLIITSDQPLQITYRLLSRPGCNNYNQDIMQIHGNPALGYAFFVGTQTDANGFTFFGSTEKHFAAVMATEDNTQITFTVPTTVSMEGSPDATANTTTDWNGSRTITLNTGQSYVIGTANEDPNRTISGTKIISDKPIVVNSGSQHTRNSQSGDADAGLAQLVPTTALATKYSVIDGGNTSGAKDYIIIVAVKNGTNFTVNGTSGATDGLGNVMPTTLNSGSVATYYFTNTLFAPYTVVASQPVYVFHVSSQTAGEYGMELLPALDPCLGTKKVDFGKPGTETRAIVYVPNSGLSSLQFNGQPYTALASTINGLQVNPIPGTDYSTVVFQNAQILASGNNRVSCEKKMQVAVLAFTGGTGNYAYYSDYLKNVEIYDPVTQLPTSAYLAGTVSPSTPITHCVSMGGCGADNAIVSAIASNGGTVSVQGNRTCITYTMNNTTPCFSEVVTLKVLNEFGISSNVCLRFNSSTTNITTPPAQLLPVTQVCKDATLTLDGTSTSPSGIGNPAGYVWTTPLGTIVNGPILSIPNIQLNGAGNYILSITDLAGCLKKTTAVVAVFNCTNNDNDAVSDLTDPDDDNDGILDVNEPGGNGLLDADGDLIFDYKDPDYCSANGGGALVNGVCPLFDADGDGVINQFDLDSDNDGIPDVVEVGGVDQNGDGILDGTDANNDGMIDSLPIGGLANLDSDGDNIPNSIDLDSDNDGIPDIIEVGGKDVNNDGRVDGFTDTGNGLADAYDLSKNGIPLTSTGPDTDNNGTANSYLADNQDKDARPNFLDVDSDNDGLTDTREAGGTDANGDGRIDGSENPLIGDANRDGWLDLLATTPLPIKDSDSDGLANYLDIDSDGDGLPDVLEMNGIDPNNDGIIGNTPFVDSDGDGLSDVVDSDNGGTPLPKLDTDTDNFENYVDIDSDKDGIVDIIEAQSTTGYQPPLGRDTDGDGLDDRFDTTNGGTAIFAVNTDGADNPDYLDTDSDNDTISDQIEGYDTNNDGVANTLPSGLDVDNDGLDNAFDADGKTSTNAGKADNNGQLPTDPFPDNANVGGDRDWRQAKDSDGDGVADSNDLDNDNDGIPDLVEGNGDSDGDGIPNRFDRDSDNDGILDIVEAGGLDPDNDGAIGTGATITDTNLNGLDDSIDPTLGKSPLPTPNTDGDGKPNFLDLDSDNDGIMDVREAGGADTDGNGVLDNLADNDKDGIADIVDLVNGGTPGVPLPVVDTDKDGLPNYKDLDSDNDAIADVVEAGLGALDTDNDGVVNGTDTDNDGVINVALLDNNSTFGASVADPLNSDSDPIPNYIDIDSDNDGITDIREVGLANLDANNDGSVDVTGVPLTDDPDQDGMINKPGLDTNNIFGGIANKRDTDGDGKGDYIDIDADNDGIVDIIEAQSTIGYQAPLGIDTDSDGLDDRYDVNNSGTAIIPVNTDGADNPDYLDLDSDNDTLLDIKEGYKPNKTPTGSDKDKDGLDDAFDADLGTTNTAGATNGGQTAILSFPGSAVPGDDQDWRERSKVDTDKDGIPDLVDVDDDNDGIIDTAESNGIDPLKDADGDGIVNYLDPTPGVGIPAFVDANSDGISDAFDTDLDGVINSLDLDGDNDGIPDLVEAGGVDTNGDGQIDSKDDIDQDGLIDLYDPSAGGKAIADLDTDGDGIPNRRDTDSDNDGIPDVIEAGGIDANNDGKIDGITDTDGDGFADTVDGDVGNDGTAENTAKALIITGTDTDNDGKPNTYPRANADANELPNPYDLDADSDGILDSIEAGIPDSDKNGIADDTGGADGWSDTVDGLASLPLINTDGKGKPNYLDIDSDDDGIVDIIEAQPTDTYKAPSGIDADGDGLDDAFDNAKSTFGGNSFNGLIPVDTETDGTNDYVDSDSDNDSLNDNIEGWDVNGNGVIDGTEPSPAASVDIDSDGLLDQYDTNTAASNPTNATTPISYPDVNVKGGDRDWREVRKTDISVPEIFSPDGNGVNDFFEISNPSRKAIKFTVFNRWGNIVYTVDTNDDVKWNGVATQGLVIGSDLPDGTYFYLLSVDGVEQKPKSFTLKR